MTKTNPQDGKQYDEETHQWIDVAPPVEKKSKPAVLPKPEPLNALEPKE